MSYFPDLHEKIFLEVLSARYQSYPTVHLPATDYSLLHPLSAVSQHWRDLFFRPKLWRRVCIDTPAEYHICYPTCPCAYENPPKPDIFSVLHRMAPHINILTVEGSVFDPSTRVFTNCPTFPNVTDLTFNVVTRLTPMEFDLMAELFPKVEKFVIDVDEYTCTHLGDRSLQLFAAGWPNLVEIELSGCYKLTGAGLIQFVSVANRLQHLGISGLLHLSNRDVDLITRLLGKSLKSITIGFNQQLLSGVAIQSIAKNCPLLEEICIQGSMSVWHLRKLVNLRRVRISGKFVNCWDGVDRLFSRPLGQLREFEIWNAENVRDTLLERIAKCCPLLEKLIIVTPRKSPAPFVTDSAVDQIVNNCSHLYELYLSGFSAITGSSFIGAREKLPKLKHLDFSDCPMVDEKAIKTAFFGVQEEEKKLTHLQKLKMK